MKREFATKWFLVLLVGLFAACGTDETVPGEGEGTDRPVDENGKATFFSTDAEEIAPGKSDAVSGQRGLPVSVDRLATAVWTVENAWDDTDTPAARAAGMAWGENSGLTWDEKYQAWVDSLDKIDSEGGFFSSETFMLTTPWGKEVPSPTLECAEVAIFLRITFASWYNLPFFLEARDANGRIYFGHFGMRTDNGKFGRMPNFRDRYPDFSDRADSVLSGGDWPSDSELRGKKIPGSFDDEQPQLGEGLHAGAYFDEVFLNKRVGHFLILTLAWYGSVNLADSANTFNLRPAAIRPGDVLVERWQRVGIGHTLVVMNADEVGSQDVDGEIVPQLEVEVASGSMPRRQPVWESSGASKRYFSLSATGGEGKESFGGGLKRWRTAKNVSGRWTNVVPRAYAGDWVNSSDHEAISARLERFRNILVELSPEQRRDVLLDIIEGKRQHLRQFPASCAARISREEAFDSLYELAGEEFGMTPSEVDAQFRTFEDYVFAELEYEKSKTCCWNRSTNAMYEIAIDLNVSRQEEAAQCIEPIVFMNRDDGSDGFELFRQHAIALDRGGDWVDWSADESCPWQDIPEATIAEADHLEFCSLPDGGGPTEPIDDRDSDGFELSFDAGVAIPDNDSDGVRLTASWDEAGGEIVGAALDVEITHTWRGDLEIELVHPDGTVATLKESNGSDNADDVNQRFEIPDFFGKQATGDYTLVVRDTAAMDTGTVESATLHLEVAQ